MDRRYLFIFLAVFLAWFGSIAFAQNCTNLECQQQICPDPSVTTSISGTVYAPNGVDPLPNVLVYIPNGTVEPFTPGVACLTSGETASGSPLVSTTTDAKGKFTLTNAPVGTNIPLIIQAGRWRRQTTISNVAACTATAVPAAQTRFPRTQAEGDIPRIAIVTGAVDAVECVLRKIGIADSEFTNPTGTGRVNFYVGTNGSNPPGGAHIGYSSPSEDVLFDPQSSDSGAPPNLHLYDMVMFPCQGMDVTDSVARIQANQDMLAAYADAGGRIFATHFSYEWMFTPDLPPSFTPAFPGVANWTDNYVNYYPPDQMGFVNTGFAKGDTLAQWLKNVGAGYNPGQIYLQTLRRSQTGVISPPSQPWLTINSPSEVVQFTFNTPLGADPAQQCGRVLFNEYHVENAVTQGRAFPTECTAGVMTPQEKLLEFSIFDLSTFVSPDISPRLSLTVTNSPATFMLGDSADTLTLNITNSSTNPATPSLGVTATLPFGLVATSMAGTNANTGWTCDLSSLSCTRATGLDAGASDPIAISVSVSTGASLGAGALVVSATATGGGLANDLTAQDAVSTMGTLLVTAADAYGTYNQPMPALTYNITGFAGSDTQSSATTGAPDETTSATATSTPGQYPIVITQGALAAANYIFQFQNGTFYQQTAVPTVSFTGAPASAPYQGTFTVTATTNASSTAVITAIGPCTIAGDVVTMTSGTGTCTLKADWPADANYSSVTLSQSTVATTIAPTVSFTGAPATAPYQGTFTVAATTNASITAVITATGSCTIAGNTVTMNSGTGTCNLSATWAADSNYSSATATQATAAIKATANVTFTGAPATAPYHSGFMVSATTNASIAAVITASGACSVAGNAVTMTSGTGTCALTATWAADDNYATATAAQATAATTIAPTVTFTGAPASAAYLSTFTVAATTNSSTSAVITATGSCTIAGNTVTITSGTGVCNLVANWAADSNYDAASLTQSTNATKPVLTVTAPSTTKTLNAPNPPLGNPTYSGFVGQDGVGSLGGSVTCTTTATLNSLVGSYPITCSGLTSSNYTINYVPGALKILYAAGSACGGDWGHTILQPISADGMSVWKQGRSVPAKFRVCDANGVSIGSAGVVASFNLVQIIAGTVADVNEIVDSTSADGVFRWDGGSQQWIFNISTSDLNAGYTYVYAITLNDGSVIRFQYGLR